MKCEGLGCDAFMSCTRYVVGDGDRLRLWHDIWCSNGAL